MNKREVPEGCRFLRVAFTLACCLAVTGTLDAQDADSLPEGEGRQLVIDRCGTCHPLSTALLKSASRDAWEETINRMVMIYMAPIDVPDAAIILDYLTAHFGETSAYNPGQRMLAEQCFRCHGEGMWTDLKTDRSGWLSVLYRMIGRGGVWTEDQINVMADYLTATYSQGAEQ